jgi:hypothetical protein
MAVSTSVIVRTALQNFMATSLACSSSLPSGIAFLGWLSCVALADAKHTSAARVKPIGKTLRNMKASLVNSVRRLPNPAPIFLLTHTKLTTTHFAREALLVLLIPGATKEIGVLLTPAGSSGG